jgi:hypothetical protein
MQEKSRNAGKNISRDTLLFEGSLEIRPCGIIPYDI